MSKVDFMLGVLTSLIATILFELRFILIVNPAKYLAASTQRLWMISSPFSKVIVQHFRTLRIDVNVTFGVIFWTVTLILTLGRITGYIPPSHDYPECLQYNDCPIAGD